MTDENRWEFDFEGWTLGEDALYMEQLAKAQRSGDFRPLFSHWARMIRQWPLALNPSTLGSYSELGEAAYREIIDQINRGIRYPKREESRLGGAET